MVFKNVDGSDIDYVQKFIKDRALLVYSEAKDESFGEGCEAVLHDEDLVNIYGRTYASAPTLFQFHAGDVKLIKSLVDHVKNVVDGNGDNKGLRQFRSRKRATVRFKKTSPIDKSKENVTPSATQTKNEIRTDTTEKTEQHAHLKLELYKKTSFLLNSFKVSGRIVAMFDLDMIEVLSEGDGIYGSIICVICRDENTRNQKPKRVCYHKSSQSGYWVMANFMKHLKQHHQLVFIKMSNEVKREKIAYDSALKPKKCFSDNKPSDKLKSVSESVEWVESADNEGIHDEDVDDDEIAFEVVSIAPQMQPHQKSSIYEQLSTQMTKMVEAVLINGDVQQSMKFRLNGQERSVTVASINGDGNCLFGAICHQLFYGRINSESHIEEMAALRKNVVSHILQPENYPSFEHALKDRVYEIKKKNEIENITTECKLFTRLNLSQRGKWGGYETSKAVGEMYNVNILTFKEDDGCYISKSKQICDRTIVLAYRKTLINNESVYYHYDSICDIDTHLLFEISEFVTNETQLSSVQTDHK